MHPQLQKETLAPERDLPGGRGFQKKRPSSDRLSVLSWLQDRKPGQNEAWIGVCLGGGAELLKEMGTGAGGSLYVSAVKQDEPYKAEAWWVRAQGQRESHPD